MLTVNSPRFEIVNGGVATLTPNGWTVPLRGSLTFFDGSTGPPPQRDAASATNSTIARRCAMTVQSLTG
jgi:hypothetical protein